MRLQRFRSSRPAKDLSPRYTTCLAHHSQDPGSRAGVYELQRLVSRQGQLADSSAVRSPSTGPSWTALTA